MNEVKSTTVTHIEELRGDLPTQVLWFSSTYVGVCALYKKNLLDTFTKRKKYFFFSTPTVNRTEVFALYPHRAGSHYMSVILLYFFNTAF